MNNNIVKSSLPVKNDSVIKMYNCDCSLNLETHSDRKEKQRIAEDLEDLFSKIDIKDSLKKAAKSMEIDAEMNSIICWDSLGVDMASTKSITKSIHGTRFNRNGFQKGNTKQSRKLLKQLSKMTADEINFILEELKTETDTTTLLDYQKHYYNHAKIFAKEYNEPICLTRKSLNKQLIALCLENDISVLDIEDMTEEMSDEEILDFYNFYFEEEFGLLNLNSDGKFFFSDS